MECEDKGRVNAQFSEIVLRFHGCEGDFLFPIRVIRVIRG
jgi:hypothetical protein